MGLNVLTVVCVYPTEEGSSKFLACARIPPPQFRPLVRHSDLPIRKSLRRVFGLLIAMILTRVSESVFFQTNKFTACKIKDGKEAANSLMVFHLLNNIHPFQGKKHLRT